MADWGREVPVARNGLAPKKEHGNVHCPSGFISLIITMVMVHLQARALDWGFGLGNAMQIKIPEWEVKSFRKFSGVNVCSNLGTALASANS